VVFRILPQLLNFLVPFYFVCVRLPYAKVRFIGISKYVELRLNDSSRSKRSTKKPRTETFAPSTEPAFSFTPEGPFAFGSFSVEEPTKSVDVTHTVAANVPGSSSLVKMMV
jgi:hypothetical protein